MTEPFGRDMAVTEALAAWIADPAGDPVSDVAVLRAKHALLDWIAVTLAGRGEPVARILIDEALLDSGQGGATVIGTEIKLPPSAAALVNGAASHALDYDDVNMRMRGHPSVAILPALLAASAQRDVSGHSFLEAFVIGTEVACIVGEMMGPDHYERGFHNTATIGTFGAAAGVSRLLGLRKSEASAALGLAATQASGLRAMFGSMGKPLHAGTAAKNGYLAARWAAAGMTAPDAVLEGALGFGETQSSDFRRLAVRQDRTAPFGIEANVFKYHAACYYTHSAIDVLSGMRRSGVVVPDEIESVVIGMTPGCIDACDIRAPRDGLEVKFSMRHLAAMAIHGWDTGAIGSFTETAAADSALVDLRKRISVAPEDLPSRSATRVQVTTTGGACLTEAFDVGIPEPDEVAQRARLERKFLALCTPILGREAAVRVLELTFGLDCDGPVSRFVDLLAVK